MYIFAVYIAVMQNVNAFIKIGILNQSLNYDEKNCTLIEIKYFSLYNS
mgnify:CR=1 FL=1